MPVRVSFTSDTKDLEAGAQRAEKSIKGVGDAADDAGKKSGGFSSALKGASTVAGGFVLGTAITKAPGFLLDAAKAAAEDEQATARLDQALRNAGGSFDENKKKIDDRIAAGAKLAFSDDDVRDSFQSLLVATDDVDEALRRQQVAMDLSRGTGMSLTQASKLLGKVNQENVDAFKKLGIEIPKTATEQEALAIVQGKFAGQADTYASSSAAQMEKFNQQMGELQETIGTAVLPVLTALGTVLADDVVPALSSVAEDVAPKIAAVLVPAIAAISVGFQAAAPYVQQVVGFLADHQEVLAAFGIAVTAVVVPALVAWAVSAGAAAVATIAATAPIIGIIAAIALLSLGIIEVVKHWDDITAKYPVIGQISDALKEKFQAFVNWINDPFIPTLQSIYDTVSTVISTTVGFVTDHWHEVWDVMEPVLSLISDGVVLYFGIVQTTVETVINAVRDIINIVMGLLTGDWDRAWNGLSSLVTDIWEGIKTTISLAIGFIQSDLVPLMLAAAGKLGEALKDGIVEGVKGIVNNVGEITDALIGALKGAVNSAMQWMHDNVRLHIPGFDPPGPGSFPDFDWGFPLIQFAKGGIVTGPTNALIGEAGPEAVIPLTSGALTAITGGTSGGGGGESGASLSTFSNARQEDVLKDIDRILQRGYDYEHNEITEWRGGMIDQLIRGNDYEHNEVTEWRRGVIDALIRMTQGQSEMLSALTVIARALDVDHLIDAISRRQSQGWSPTPAAA